MSYKDKEKQKEYNKKYYELNKTKILCQVLEKKECPYCNRKINHQNMSKHSKTKYCIKNTKVVEDIEQH
jgi:hypothetical protein